MALGARLKQARLEAGLSQRQLCGDTITRNMLSQIENGSARPSMDTLGYLASRLGKPISFFLEEQPAQPPNQAVMLRARQAHPQQVLALLQAYQAPDPIFDPERWLLEALTCMTLAEEAIGQDKKPYALSLLDRAKAAGEKTGYYTQDLERRRLLLCFMAGADPKPLEAALPDMTAELLLRAQAEEDPVTAGQLLDAARQKSPRWHYLRGKAWEDRGDYRQAIAHYLQAQDHDPMQIYRCLERCYQAIEDYKQAYFYACKQR